MRRSEPSSSSSLQKSNDIISSATKVLPSTIKGSKHNVSLLPYGSLVEAFFYVVFLVIFVVVTTFFEQNDQAFYFSNRLQHAILHSSSSGTKEIQDMKDVWDFLQGPLSQVIYEDKYYNEELFPIEQQGIVLTSNNNRLLGGLRLRTIRVRPNSCQRIDQIPSEYTSLIGFCYGELTQENEQTEGYGPILNSHQITPVIAYQAAKKFYTSLQEKETKEFTDLTNCKNNCQLNCGVYYGIDKIRYEKECTNACNIYCTCLYDDYTKGCSTDPNLLLDEKTRIPNPIYSFNWSQIEGVGIDGFVNSFPASGYVVNLPVNATIARNKLNQLKKDRFIDLATRGLVIEFTLYNGYLQLFNSVQYVFEFPSTGGVLMKTNDVMMDFFRYSTPYSTTRIFFEIVLVLYIGFCWYRTLKQMYQQGFGPFVSTSWFHRIEIVHLVLFLVVICLRLYQLDLAYGTLRSGSSQLNLQKVDTSSYIGLGKLIQVDNLLMSLNAAFVWLKLVKYTQMFQRMSVLLRTLEKAMVDIGWFCVYVLICILCFAQIGFYLFGFSMKQFRTFGVSILTCLQAIAGDLQYEQLVDTHFFYGPLFYLCFYMVMMLMLLNVFLAIINDAYTQVLKEDKQEKYTRPTEDEEEEDNEDDDRYMVDHLRRYPFSQGLWIAWQLFSKDMKRTFFELKTGHKHPSSQVQDVLQLTQHKKKTKKIKDTKGPSIKNLSTMSTTSTINQSTTLLHASRSVQQETEKQQQQLREEEFLSLQDKLTQLCTSQQGKSKRMDDLENLLESIEQLCQKIVNTPLNTTTTNITSLQPSRHSNVTSTNRSTPTSTTRTSGKSGSSMMMPQVLVGAGELLPSDCFVNSTVIPGRIDSITGAGFTNRRSTFSSRSSGSGSGVELGVNGPPTLGESTGSSSSTSTSISSPTRTSRPTQVLLTHQMSKNRMKLQKKKPSLTSFYGEEGGLSLGGESQLLSSSSSSTSEETTDIQGIPTIQL